jgi:hypothetical protein
VRCRAPEIIHFIHVQFELQVAEHASAHAASLRFRKMELEAIGAKV